jgi:hypothetical protein
VNSDSELHFLHRVTSQCAGQSVGRDSVWQLAPVFASIPYSPQAVDGLRAFDARISRVLPMLSAHGRARAKRAFVRTKDSITKPSYISRLRTVVDGKRTQLDVLGARFCQEPSSGGLVFSIFQPRDLLARKRPGYVPCLVSGSVLLHESRLHLNAFFRSQSIVEFGVHDLLFLRTFQADLVDAFRKMPAADFPKRSCPRRIDPGPLNLHFGRVIIQSRLARHGLAYMRRSEVFDTWMKALVATMEERSSEGPMDWHEPARSRTTTVGQHRV